MKFSGPFWGQWRGLHIRCPMYGPVRGVSYCFVARHGSILGLYWDTLKRFGACFESIGEPSEPFWRQGGLYIRRPMYRPAWGKLSREKRTLGQRSLGAPAGARDGTLLELYWDILGHSWAYFESIGEPSRDHSGGRGVYTFGAQVGEDMAPCWGYIGTC